MQGNNMRIKQFNFHSIKVFRIHHKIGNSILKVFGILYSEYYPRLPGGGGEH